MHTAVMAAEAVSILNLMILLFSKLRGEKTHRTSAAFIVCLAVAVFCVSMDLLSYALEYIICKTFWLVLVNMLSFLGYDFELMAFSVYIWTMAAEKEYVSRRFSRFILIVCVADILLVVVGTVTGQLFSIQGGLYVTGPWYNLGGVIGFVVLVSLLVFAIKKRKTVGNKPVVFIAVFFVVTYTSVFITLFTGIDSYLYVCMSLVMLLVYIILQTGEIEQGQMRERIMFETSTTDILTKLNNRRAFENALAASAGASSAGVIFCDVNGLKTANDNLGHAAGDALLQRFAELLKKHFSSSDIFRISGDEFVVLQQNAKESAFRADVDRLKAAVARQQEIASVGCAFGNGSSVLDLVSIAEKDMYTDKKSYYERHGLNRRRT